MAAAAILVALTCLITGFVGTALLRSYLYSRADAQLRDCAAVASRVLERSHLPVRHGGHRQTLPSQFLVEVLSADGRVQRAETPLRDAGGPRLSAAQLRHGRIPFTAPASDAAAHSWRVLVKPLSGGRHAIIAFSLDNLNSTVTRLEVADALAGAIAIAVLAGIGLPLVRASLAPLARIETTAAAIAGGDLSRRIDHPSRDTEVGRMADALDTMLGRIEAAYQARAEGERRALRSEDRMRQFVADASHELRTPLTSVRGLAEFGLEQGQAACPEELLRLMRLGTDVTVTQPPTAGSGGGTRFNFPGGPPGQQKTGTSFSRDILAGRAMGTIKSSSVTTVSGLKDVASATGALVLNDLKLSGTVPAGGSQPGAQGGTGAGSINSSSFTVTGVDPSHDSLGPLSSGAITVGHNLTAGESNSNVTVVNSDYAKAQNLNVGSTITVAGKALSVIGIVQPAQGESSVDVYIPLARAQALANMPGEVNTIYVSAASASDIGAVSAEISRALPTATVTTSSNLASEVTGSLASASTLANSLGTWLAVAVLAAAFGLASILTIVAVSRRVREFGTLKAMGWHSRRIIRQIMGEALVTGIVGGAAGVGIGYGAAAMLETLAPPLTATTTAGSGGPGGPGGPGGRFGQAAASAAHTVSAHLIAPVTADAVALAVALAIAGAVIAGSLGGWRAARLRPAAALARVA